MKKTVLMLTATLLGLISKAQNQNVSINFDHYNSATDNDLVNNFTLGMSSPTQSSGNGITGGAVIPSPNSANSGAILNQHIVVSQTAVTAFICFKFSSALYAGSSSDYATNLYFSLVNHFGYFNMFATGNSIGVSSTGIVNTTFVGSGGTLTDGHWYKLQSDFRVNGADTEKLLANVYLYDLGTSGTATPAITLQKQNIELGNDFYYYPGEDISLTMYGTQTGGASYLDNFNVQWTGPLGIAAVNNIPGLSVPTVVTSDMPVSVDSKEMCSFELFNLNGSRIKSGTFSSKTDILTADLVPGTYLVVFRLGTSFTSRKIVKL